MIVGFPGETEADFAATCGVVEEVGFAKVHVFRFSPREGTPAAVMPRQVTERIAQSRAMKLGNLSEMLRDRCFRQLLGRQLRVLVEMPIAGHPGWMGGTSDDHSPIALPGGREPDWPVCLGHCPVDRGGMDLGWPLWSRLLTRSFLGRLAICPATAVAITNPLWHRAAGFAILRPLFPDSRRTDIPVCLTLLSVSGYGPFKELGHERKTNFPVVDGGWPVGASCAGGRSRAALGQL